MAIWKTKLAAWLQDSTENALLPPRDRTGQERGTAAELREALFGERAMPAEIKPVLERADGYAAADRPQWPTEENGARHAAWARVDFAASPVLIHPLTGAPRALPVLADITPDQVNAASLGHFQNLIVRDGQGQPDFNKTLLAYWRFGPDAPAGIPVQLWRNLPADPRVPDRSIWAHRDCVSAFAGAMAADATATPALLAVSFGPVQGFIAEARATSDLWAGSHLLARIAWEGMKIVCEKLGPDALLFPQLRRVPLVDRWLRDEVGLPAERFRDEEWVKGRTDANPLFAAALPNRFVAIVPADQAAALAEAITRRVREFVAGLGDATLRKILEEIDEPWRDDLPCVAQMKAQIDGFPEVHWAAVPWSLAEGPEVDGKRPALAGLYPALYELLDRVAAAAKTARPFEPLRQTGYRSTLNGEREWLTLADEIPEEQRPADLPIGMKYLDLPPGRRGGGAGQVATLWTRLADKHPSWVKLGEHLDALAAIKRLWPTLFTEEVRGIVGEEVRRYVVSTHTLALAVSLEQWLDKAPRPEMPLTLRKLLECPQFDDLATALPRRIALKLHDDPDAQLLCRNLPGVLDALKDEMNADARDERQRRRARQAEEMLVGAEEDMKELFGAKPETYYGLILMDGDHMGAWLSGGKEGYPMPSPARHGAISEALNQFSQKTARFVVEDCFKGKLIYAGGDDVLAFVCVDDLLPAMTLLRCLYSGRALPAWLAARLDDRERKRFESNNGWLLLDGDLLPTMGEKATASCGAVVAHHQAPLGMVLRTLREAESAAKNRGERDAFSLRILKRAGGQVAMTDKWFRGDGDSAAGLLDALMRMLARDGVSRRAAFNSVEWLAQLPEVPDAELLKTNLAYQFARQAKGEDIEAQMKGLAIDLASYASRHHAGTAAKTLGEFLMAAEFLARDTRHPETA